MTRLSWSDPAGLVATMATTLATTLATVVSVAVLAGCGGGDTDTPPTRTPDATPTTTALPSTPTEPVDPTAYLPVPDGSTLTVPGTELRFRDAALGAWTPRQDLVGVLRVRVLEVERTTVKRSLAPFTLTRAERTSTPYFVTSRVGNEGDTDLGGRQAPLYVVDSVGRLLPPTGVDQDFAACPGSRLPAVFAPGDVARSCLIFLVPARATLESVMFRPPEGVVPITWTGKVQQLGGRKGGAPMVGNSGGKGG